MKNNYNFLAVFLLLQIKYNENYKTEFIWEFSKLSLYILKNNKFSLFNSQLSESFPGTNIISVVKKNYLFSTQRDAIFIPMQLLALHLEG